MFVTDAQARQPFLSDFLAEGQEVWSCVRISLQVPWFIVRYRVVDDDGDGDCHYETVMLSDVAQVAEMIKDGATHGMDVREVDLVSPAYLNGTDGWRLERVREVAEARHSKMPMRVLIYRLEDGREYCNPPSPLDVLTDYKLIVKVCAPKDDSGFDSA